MKRAKMDGALRWQKYSPNEFLLDHGFALLDLEAQALGIRMHTLALSGEPIPLDHCQLGRIASVPAKTVKRLLPKLSEHFVPDGNTWVPIRRMPGILPNDHKITSSRGLDHREIIEGKTPGDIEIDRYKSNDCNTDSHLEKKESGKKNNRSKIEGESVLSILGPLPPGSLEAFRELCDLFTGKCNNQVTCARAFVEAIRKGHEAESIVNSADRYRKSLQPPINLKDDTIYMKGLENWLNEEGYLAVYKEVPCSSNISRLNKVGRDDFRQELDLIMDLSTPMENS